MTRFSRRFRKIGRSLSRVSLMRSSMDETFALDAASLLDRDAGRRFLDFYGDAGLVTALERYGVYAALRTRGYDTLELETIAHDDRHTLLVHGQHEGTRHRLVELCVRRDRLVLHRALGSSDARPAGFSMLTVDWLTLRHPAGCFTPARLRLPGQDAPGLGIGERVMELLYRVVDRLGLDGLVTVAEHFHNAVLYARELPYVDPFYQGQLRALERVLFARERLSFAEASWAMHWGYVLDAADRTVRWRGEAMARAKASGLAAHLASNAHARESARAERSLRYRLDRRAFDRRWESASESLLSPPTE